MVTYGGTHDGLTQFVSSLQNDCQIFAYNYCTLFLQYLHYTQQYFCIFAQYLNNCITLNIYTISSQCCCCSLPPIPWYWYANFIIMPMPDINTLNPCRYWYQMLIPSLKLRCHFLLIPINNHTKWYVYRYQHQALSILPISIPISGSFYTDNNNRCFVILIPDIYIWFW